MNGQGIFKWSNGNKYDGEFRADVMEGKGTFTWGQTGNVFVGTFSNNLMSG